MPAFAEADVVERQPARSAVQVLASCYNQMETILQYGSTGICLGHVQFLSRPGSVFIVVAEGARAQHENQTWYLCAGVQGPSRNSLGCLPNLIQAKLNCLITFRTKTVKWRKNLQGYSWKTEAEMRKPPLEWEEHLGYNSVRDLLTKFKHGHMRAEPIRSRIQGAVRHCEKKKLTK